MPGRAERWETTSVLQTVDIARLAEEIDQPYQPTPLASAGGFSASLFVCDDLRSWQRDDPFDTLLFILEGVLVLESGSNRAVANDGDVLAIPRKHGHNLSAGMRSSVILIGTDGAPPAGNGHMPPPYAPAGGIQKVHMAAEVLQGQPFEWLPVGTAGPCRSFASRLWGASLPFTSPDSCLLLVYRGVLDFEVAGQTGSVVGSQMIVIPPGMTIGFDSPRGATVLLMTRDGSPLPEAMPSGEPHGGGGADRSGGA
jgi:mannose-6-phosphate isomerase-like protein (cupin superfamily)